jgi:hypothetical protein
MKNEPAPFPVTLKIDLPTKELNRLTTAFRLFMIVPVAILIGLLSGATGGPEWAHPGWSGPWRAGAVAGGVLFVPTLLLLLFRHKYPRWWFDWNVHFLRFSLRLGAYAALLTDVYPSADEDQCVHLKIPYPDAKQDLNRWLPLVKWFLAIPHFVVLFFLGIGAAVCVIIAWFGILFTGRYPKDLAPYVAGVMRYGVRVCAYAFLLVTDAYPPFSLV